VNNAAYWHAVEELLAEGEPDRRSPIRALLDHRHAIDLGDAVELVEDPQEGRLRVAFVVGGLTKAIAVVESNS
jgi:acyl-ACP thioesterase